MLKISYGLTRAELLERRKGIGGSDALAIANGQWHSLWLLKTGKMDDPDLSGEFPVVLGHCTEPLNLAWYEKKTGHDLSRLGEVAIHACKPILRCTLDGFDAAAKTVVQAKHVGAWSKPDEIVPRYFPQVIHEMMCVGVERGILSVIYGTKEPELHEILFDPIYAADYVRRCEEFWGYVLRNEPPPQEPKAGLEPSVAFDDMRVLDMAGNNLWADQAITWRESRDGKRKFDEAEKKLKGLVDKDVKRAFGNGIEIVRNKAGALAIKPL